MGSTIRRTIGALPAPAQLWLKRVRAGVRGDDWAAAVAAVRQRESKWLDLTLQSTRGLPDRRRFFVLALQTSPPWSEIECGLAMALQLRGHHVSGMLCDGLLPLCELNLGVRERPPCTVCVGWRSRYPEAFGFSWPRSSSYLSAEDRDDAERFVGGLSSPAWTTATYDGIEVGIHALRELQRYRRGFVFDPAEDAAFRSWLVSATLFVRLFRRRLADERPDVVLASSGRTLQSACLMTVSAELGIRVVTWDTEPTRPDGLVFSHGRAAVEIPLDDVWAKAATEPLSEAQGARLDQFLGSWARSRITPFPYNPTPIVDRGTIAASLGLRAGAPLITAFSNSAWDMAVVGRDVGFANAFDWLFSLVEYARGRPSVDVVIRAHPAETNVPDDLKSRTPVPAMVRQRCAPLPANVRLIAGDDPISSYVLAEMSDVVTVYSSRLGLELALTGRRPWVAGAVTYRGKGFTRDLTSRAEMSRLLDECAFGESLSADEVERARRFAYLWFFRYVTPVPILRPVGGRFSLSTFTALADGGDPVVARICDAVVTGAPFVDMANER